MATFALPRFLERHAERVEHARVKATAAQTTGTHAARARASHTAADSRSLRGIPAIGRGVAGAVAHTNPESIIERL